MGSFYLLFDSDCSFCRDFAAWVAGRSAVEPVPFSDPRAGRWVPDPVRLHASFHLVGPDDAVRSGPDALAPLAELTLGRAAGMALGWCPRPVLRRIYKWVSERRWQQQRNS